MSVAPREEKERAINNVSYSLESLSFHFYNSFYTSLSRARARTRTHTSSYRVYIPSRRVNI